MNFLIIVGAVYLIVLPALAMLYMLYVLKGKIRVYLLLLSFISLPIAFVLSRITGAIFYNARPFVVDNIAPLIMHAPDNGFPSDHVLFAATLATLVLFMNRRLGTILWGITLLIGISRIAAGVHHPIDIVGSALIAIVSVFAAHYILFWRRQSAQH